MVRPERPAPRPVRDGWRDAPPPASTRAPDAVAAAYVPRVGDDLEARALPVRSDAANSGGTGAVVPTLQHTHRAGRTAARPPTSDSLRCAGRSRRSHRRAIGLRPARCARASADEQYAGRDTARTAATCPGRREAAANAEQRAGGVPSHNGAGAEPLAVEQTVDRFEVAVEAVAAVRLGGRAEAQETDGLDRRPWREPIEGAPSVTVTRAEAVKRRDHRRPTRHHPRESEGGARRRRAPSRPESGSSQAATDRREPLAGPGPHGLPRARRRRRDRRRRPCGEDDGVLTAVHAHAASMR